MIPGTEKFQTRTKSPQFINFSPTMEYPNVTSTSGLNVHHQMTMRCPKTMPDDLDSIEFCVSSPNVATAPDALAGGYGINNELLLMRGPNTMSSGSQGDSINERRRRGHSRRTNPKNDVEQQVKWSRKNIAATMERFEPTAASSVAAAAASAVTLSSQQPPLTAAHSSTIGATALGGYGFAAGVINPIAVPLHTQLPPEHAQAYGGGGLPMNHVYSYAYYEPGAIKCHTNIPQNDIISTLPAANSAAAAAASVAAMKISSQAIMNDRTESPPRNSIRALLAKNFPSKSNANQSTSYSPSAEARHTYTTRYGTTENLYEEVNDQKIRKVLSDNRIATSSSRNIKEELRRVQHNHFRVLDELNLSLEALIMPSTPSDVSPYKVDEEDDATTTSSGAVSVDTTSTTQRRGGLLGGCSTSTTLSTSTTQQQRPLSHGSLENLSTTLNSMELKENAHSSSINPEFDEGDLDSGFSGSGSSSGASYNESLRCYKTAFGTSNSKSSMTSSEDQASATAIGVMSSLSRCGVNAVGNSFLGSPFNFSRRSSDSQRASTRSASASTTGTKPKKSFWTIKP